MTDIFRCGTERKAMETRGNWPKAPVSLYVYAYGIYVQCDKQKNSASPCRKYMLKGKKAGVPARGGRRREREKKGDVSMGFWCGESNAAITHTSSTLVFAFMTWPWDTRDEIGSSPPRCHSPFPRVCARVLPRRYNAISPSRGEIY